MKVKLLKKIRKRYSIIYYPNGVYFYDDFFEGPITVLYDSESEYRTTLSTLEKPKAYQKLYSTLLKWIEKDYGPFKNKKKKIISETLWYKK